MGEIGKTYRYVHFRGELAWVSLKDTQYPFKESGTEFKSVFQYMIYQKARHMGDEETARNILQTTDVCEIIRLDAEIRGDSTTNMAVLLLMFVKRGLDLKLKEHPSLQVTLDEAGLPELVNDMFISCLSRL